MALRLEAPEAPTAMATGAALPSEPLKLWFHATAPEVGSISAA